MSVSVHGFNESITQSMVSIKLSIFAARKYVFDIGTCVIKYKHDNQNKLYQ